jgi:hypothetical protein
MPKFTVLRQQDAFVGYVATVEAESAKAAADLAYSEPGLFRWEQDSVRQYDACRVVALDDDGNEIESTARGKF